MKFEGVPKGLGLILGNHRKSKRPLWNLLLMQLELERI